MPEVITGTLYRKGSTPEVDAGIYSEGYGQKAPVVYIAIKSSDRDKLSHPKLGYPIHSTAISV